MPETQNMSWRHKIMTAPEEGGGVIRCVEAVRIETLLPPLSRKSDGAAA